MARGIQTDKIDGNVQDARWEGQDSQSLPDRPAHPDPSRRAEFGDPEKTASHGIVGHLDAKHGLVSDKDLDAGPGPALNAVARAVIDGEQVASIEATDKGDNRAGKREGVPAGNAPQGAK